MHFCVAGLRVPLQRPPFRPPGSRASGAVVEWVANQRCKQGVPKKVRRCDCVLKFNEYMNKSIKDGKFKANSAKPKFIECTPIDTFSTTWWSKIKASTGMCERGISRLANLGAKESLRRFIWTQWQRQHIMLKMTQERRAAKADGKFRIVKVLIDQQPTWATDLGPPTEELRFTIQHLYAVVITIREQLLAPSDWAANVREQAAAVSTAYESCYYSPSNKFS